MATGTGAAIGIQSGSLMRLAFVAATACSVIVLMVLLAVVFWLALLVAERSKHGEARADQLKMRRPFFLSDGLI
jgi:site-specific recombinase